MQDLGNQPRADWAIRRCGAKPSDLVHRITSYRGQWEGTSIPARTFRRVGVCKCVPRIAQSPFQLLVVAAPAVLCRQMDSTKRSHHGFGFGSEPRLNTTSMASYSRGPDSTLEASVGKQVGAGCKSSPAALYPVLIDPVAVSLIAILQVTSKRPNAPRSHFGTSTREAASIQYSCFTFKPQ